MNKETLSKSEKVLSDIKLMSTVISDKKADKDQIQRTACDILQVVIDGTVNEKGVIHPSAVLLVLIGEFLDLMSNSHTDDLILSSVSAAIEKGLGTKLANKLAVQIITNK